MSDTVLIVTADHGEEFGITVGLSMEKLLEN